MNRHLSRLPLAALLALPGLGADAPGATKPVSFRADVAPILVKSCLGCHNAQKAQGGLNMSTFALLKKGGKTYEAAILEPGDPDASALVELVRPDGEPRMPMKQPPLKDAEIQTLERWVKQGAKFDGPSEADTSIASLVDPLKGLPKVEVKVPVADPVSALAFSPDGKTLVAAQGRKVVVFDAASGKPVATLADHPGMVTAVRISPDGKTVVAAGGRAGLFGAVTVWDLEKKAKRSEQKGHADAILSADLSPDGKTLATASYDRLIKLWDVATGKEARTLKEHTDAVYAVAFSPDGKTLASASADRTVKLWDVATGRRHQSLSDATAEVYAVAFSPDGKSVLAAGADRSIRSYTLSDKLAASLSKTAIGHDAAILRLVVSPDGSSLYSSGEDREVKTWTLPDLEPKSALADQPDWPLAIALSPDGARLAIGRYDGSLSLVETKSGKPALALLEAPGAKTAQPAKAEDKPPIARNATLNAPSPRGAVRGSKLRLTLTGRGVGQATEVVFGQPGLSATLAPAEKPNPDRLEVDLAIAPDAKPGVHRIAVQTPLGMSPSQPFAVSAHPEAAEPGPKADPKGLKPVALPATLVGTIDRPGDEDLFRIEAKAGQPLVFDTVARVMGSGLNASIALLDEAGKVVAESLDRDGDTDPDPLLTYTPEKDGMLTLRVADADYSGSGNHIYRIEAGTLPRVTSVFPLGVERGKAGTVGLVGLNLGGASSARLDARSSEPGTLLNATIALPDGSFVQADEKVVVADGPQAAEAEPNDEAGKATPVTVPGGASGRIGREGDSDLYRFEAKKSQRLIVEVFGRRLGSPIDPVVEILDAQGKPVPRAVLRPVAETAVAFRDHPSTGRNIRLTQWDDLAVGDYVLIGRELTRMFELPRNPDDDAIFWGSGPGRGGGERIGLLETTPEHHPLGQAIYKVEIHPAGSTFPPGGVPPVTVWYRNDDGGPGLGKDARVTFDPPADGVYFARVEDVRGFGGDRFGYHLVVRRPRPDFRFAVSPENPNVPRGSSAVVTVSLTRLDGFDGPVEITAEGLPPGIKATKAVVEREIDTAQLLLSADESAPASSAPTWKLKARAVADPLPGSESASRELAHEIDPGGTLGGRISVTASPELKLAARPGRVTIRPGERIELTFSADRDARYNARVPIDVRNLPRGVRVLNIGLNGVLVTEQQAGRSIFLYAEPWAEPTERPFYASGRLELLGKATGGNGAPVIDTSRESASPPIWLVVEPRKPGPQASAASPAGEGQKDRGATASP